jgi:hypothetical protein
MTLNGLGYTINSYFDIYDFSYSEGMATFTDPDHPEAYLHVLVEDGKIIKLQVLGFGKASGDAIVRSLNTILVSYGAD